MVAQLKRRPSTTYMEVVQHDINVSMRTILIDWLVEVVQVSCANQQCRSCRHAFRRLNCCLNGSWLIDPNTGSLPSSKNLL